MMRLLLFLYRRRTYMRTALETWKRAGATPEEITQLRAMGKPKGLYAGRHDLDASLARWRLKKLRAQP